MRLEHLDDDRVRTLNVQSGALRLGPGAAMEQQVRVIARRDRSQVTLPDDWYDFLRTDPESAALVPNTTYTLWFNAACRPQLRQGDYSYVAVRGEDGASIARFRWTQRHTADPVRHAYTFRTGDTTGARIVWGMKNGGECRIANVVLARL